MSKFDLILAVVVTVGGCVGIGTYISKPVPQPEVMKVYETPLIPPEDEPITRLSVEGDADATEELNNKFGW